MSLKRPVAHLDGDIVIYRCGFAVEQRPVTVHFKDEVGSSKYFENVTDAKKWLKVNVPEDHEEGTHYDIERHHIVEPAENALHAVDCQIAGILDDLQKLTGQRHTLAVYLSKGRSFREHVATLKPYKGNRDDKPKPVHKDVITEYMKDKYQAHVTEELEADDLLAMQGLRGGVVCSIDKDLLQVPCTHYDWTTGQLLTIDPFDAHYNLWSQVLSGDSTDNIVGIPGVGPAKAYRVLDEAQHQTPKGWARAAHYAYRDLWDPSKFNDMGWRDALMEMGKLVYLLRDEEDSWEKYYESVTGTRC